MIKKIFFCLITASDTLEIDYNLNPSFYLEISKKFRKFYMLNISRIINKKKKKITYKKEFLKKIPKNIILKNFDKFSELKKFLYKRKNHKFLAFTSLGRTFGFFRIFFLLGRLKFKLFILHNIGFITTKKHAHPFNLTDYFKKQFNIFYRRKFTYFFYRLFILFKLFPRTEIFFESSKKNIETLNSYPSKRLNKLFPFINLSVYKSIFHINSRSYDELIKKRNSLKQNEIVFLDSGFDHADRIRRSKAATEEERKKYYSMLGSILIKLKKYFKKKIVITLHPNTDENVAKKYLKNFKLVKYKTRNHILNAFLVVFHESSSAIDAVFLNKKMIVLQSKTMGDYFNIRNKIYPNALDIPAYKMENFHNISKKKLIKDLSKPKKKFLNYIENHLIKNMSSFYSLSSKKKSKKNKIEMLKMRGSEQILKKISKEYF